MAAVTADVLADGVTAVMKEVANGTAEAKVLATPAHVEYLLHLADNALVLGQRNAEWCGHGPVLEEDIAMANISVDLIGQARMLYQHISTLAPTLATAPGSALADHASAALDRPMPEATSLRAVQSCAGRIGAAALSPEGANFSRGGPVLSKSGEAKNCRSPITEDTLAYFRNAPGFRNFTLLELPHSVTGDGDASGARDYAVTLVRNFLYSALMVLRWEALRQSTDPQLAAISERSLKEARYHLRHSRDWLVRLGDGTPESHAKTQAAWDHLLPYTLEFWTEFAIENEISAKGIGIATARLQTDWQALVNSAAIEATLTLPGAGTVAISVAKAASLPQGKHGIHSAHLEPLLAEMQSLARQHPGATW